MPERVAGLSSRSPGHQYHSITTEDLVISHTDCPVVKSVENVWRTEASPNAGIPRSDPGVGLGVGRWESRDYGRQDQVDAGTSSLSLDGSIDHYPSPSASSPDSPTYPGIYVPTPGCLIPDQVISRIEEIVADEDGTNLTDHYSRDATQLFADAVHEVCLHTP